MTNKKSGDSVSRAIERWGKNPRPSKKRPKPSTSSRSVTDAQRDRIVDLYENNPTWTIRDITDAVDFHYSTVARVLKEAGATFKRGRPPTEIEVPDAVQEKVVRLYESGLSITAIAEKLDRLSYTRVRKILLHHNVKIRGRCATDESRLEIAALVLEWRGDGYTLQECADDLGMTRQGVHRIEKQARVWRKAGLI